MVSMWTAPSAIVSGATARPESIRSRLSSDSWVAVTSRRAGLGGPACGAGGRVGGEEHLQPGGRPDDGPDVAALDDDPAGADDVALELDQPGADRRDGAHRRDRRVDGVGADLDGHVDPVEGDRRPQRVGAGLQLRGVGVCGHLVHVVDVDVVLQHPPRHRAIHRTGVEVAEAEPVGHGTAGARLARARRTVDGYDERAEITCIHGQPCYR